MGTSTNGLLWYGVALDDEDEELGEIFETILYGANEDDDRDGDGREWFAEHGIAGVEIVTHCSGDYPMYGFAVEGTVTIARRGYPQRVSTAERPDASEVLAAARALKTLGIDVEEPPVGWHLASYWG